MPEQRQVYRAGNSLVVALPLSVREHLRIEPGESVYWHLVRGAEAIIGKRPRRVGGGPEGIALQKQLDAARVEIERLRRKLGARPRKVLGEGISHGWSVAMRAEGSLVNVLVAIEHRLDTIEARLPLRQRGRRVAVVPTPALAPPPSSPSSSGEAVTPGAKLPGHP
jgi:antitoxin component of MazEF toxin-antitoxin module